VRVRPLIKLWRIIPRLALIVTEHVPWAGGTGSVAGTGRGVAVDRESCWFSGSRRAT